MAPRSILLVLVTALTGCGSPGGAPAFIDGHADVSTRMSVIAQRFELDRSQGGMSEVAADVGRCYAEATRYSVVQTFALRDCLILDYVGYRTSAVGSHAAVKPALPFFSDQAAPQRWEHYGPLAQFDTSQRLYAYLANSSSLVQNDLVKINSAPSRKYWMRTSRASAG